MYDPNHLDNHENLKKFSFKTNGKNMKRPAMETFISSYKYQQESYQYLSD